MAQTQVTPLPLLTSVFFWEPTDNSEPIHASQQANTTTEPEYRYFNLETTSQTLKAKHNKRASLGTHSRAGDLAQQHKFLPCKHVIMSSIPATNLKKKETENTAACVP